MNPINLLPKSLLTTQRVSTTSGPGIPAGQPGWWLPAKLAIDYAPGTESSIRSLYY
jgi:hypothetical protein